jgi:hypothetical protein
VLIELRLGLGRMDAWLVTRTSLHHTPQHQRSDGPGRNEGHVKRKKLYTALAVLALIIGVGAAWAWYAGQGTSDPTQVAKGGTSPLSVQLTISGAASELYPSDNTDFSFQVANNSGHGRAHIGGVEVTEITTDPTSCDAGWFETSDVAFTDLPANGVLAEGANANGTGTLTFLDEDLAQDDCSDAIINVTLQTTP